METATCFAPATVANVAVGFDVLGFSFDALGDVVSVTRAENTTRDARIVLDGVDGSVAVPADPRRNTATVALRAMAEALGLTGEYRVRLRKGIPLAGGMGGSAASAVGAVVALGALLDEPPPHARLLEWALAGEEAASGARHADNAAACLRGGLVAVVGSEPIGLPVPAGLGCIVLRPHLELETRAQRAMLRRDVPLALHVQQSARLLGFVTACFQSDLGLLGRSARDDLIEPQRAASIPGFADAREAAREAGALVCSISGSGPSLFAWARLADRARVGGAMQGVFTRHGIGCDTWTSDLPGQGARIVSR